MESSPSSQQIVENLRSAFAKLREPITQVDQLLEALRSPLLVCGLLTSNLARASPNLAHDRIKARSPITRQLARLIASIQSAVLTQVVPVWDVPLTQDGNAESLEQIFSPPIPSEASFSADNTVAAAREFALSAYSVLLSAPISPFTLRILPQLLKHYPIDDLHELLFPSEAETRLLEWEVLVKTTASLSTKVANALGDNSHEIPSLLQTREYSIYLCQRYDILVSRLSRMKRNDAQISSAAHLLNKMVQIGLFPLQSADQLRVSYFSVSWSSIRSLSSPHDPVREAYSRTWTALLAQLPSSGLQAFLTSFFSAIPLPKNALSVELPSRREVKRHARMLSLFVPRVLSSEELADAWAIADGVLLGRNWNEHIGRVAVCWVSSITEANVLDESALITFSERVLDVWSSAQHTQNPLVARHRYITSTLLLSWSYLPPDHAYVNGLATSPKFLGAVSKYLGNMEPAVRLMGMAVAEEVAKLSGRKLEFGNWDGDADGRPWIRSLRALIKERDADVDDGPDDENITAKDEDPQAQAHEGHSSPILASGSSLPSVKILGPDRPTAVPSREPDSDDDSLIGYDSEPSSSRAPSPTPSELEEIEKDPTLRSGGGMKRKKIVRPVYLVSLGELLRPSKAEGEEEVEKIEMALTHGEELIRRKRDYGTELEENAADLCFGVLGLQDKYDLDRFEERRLEILAALVACCPVISAPCLIEQFFHNQWSATQRFAILNALALGARELAGLSVPVTAARQSSRLAFPSKLLPASLHNKYVAEDEAAARASATVASIADGITRLALDKGKAEAEEKVPELIREKQLRIRKKTPTIVPVGAGGNPKYPSMAQQKPHVSYSVVAAEYFVVPLIEAFWTYLRDEQTRESRTQLSGNAGYRGAGTGMILDALILKHFLSTLAVLVHAARHSTAFLNILAPSALELAGTIGSRPVTTVRSEEEDDDDNLRNIDKENSVLAASLELALVVLDACSDIDSGRTLALEHTSSLAGTREWSSEIFVGLDASGGMMINQASGEAINRVRRAAAGVLLRIEEMWDQWKRAMITL